MRSRVTVRGQTVVPQEIRKALGITPGTVLDWTTENGVILAFVVSGDPVRASVGVLKGKGSFEGFLAERGAERARERGREAKGP